MPIRNLVISGPIRKFSNSSATPTCKRIKTECRDSYTFTIGVCREELERKVVFTNSLILYTQLRNANEWSEQLVFPVFLMCVLYMSIYSAKCVSGILGGIQVFFLNGCCGHFI